MSGPKRQVAYAPFSEDEIRVVETRIRRACHPKQADFVFDPARYISLLTGRGAGKTTGELFRLVRALMRGSRITRMAARCLYVAKTRDVARLIIWFEIKDLIGRLNLTERVKFDETRYECTFSNGSLLKLLGFDESDEIEKARGQTWHEVTADETGSARPDIIRRMIEDVIGPRLVGALVLIGTPGYTLEGLFYEVTRPAGTEEVSKHRPYAQRDEYPADWAGWSSHAWSIEDAILTGIPAILEINEKQLLEKVAHGWSDNNPKWLRERKGQWALDDATHVYAYRPFDDKGNELNQWTPVIEIGSTRWSKLPPGFDPKTWGYGISMDVGWKDAFALEAFAYRYEGDRTFWHIGEFYKTKQSARAIATLLIGPDLNIDTPAGIIGELGWPDFMVADLAGQGDRFVQSMLEEFHLRITGADKHPKYKDPAIENVNADMFDGYIRIMKDSMLAKEASNLQWVMDSNGRRTENTKQANHACFIAGTMIETENGPRPIENVNVGDLVWTRRGLRAVTASWCEGVRDTVTLETELGLLRGTPDHPVWTERGWVPIAELMLSDMIVGWESTGPLRSQSSEERNIDDTHSLRSTTYVATIELLTAPPCIELSGLPFADRFRRDFISITKTATRAITGSATWIASHLQTICLVICLSLRASLSLCGIFRRRNSLRPSGTGRRSVARGIISTQLTSPPTRDSTTSHVSSVNVPSHQSIRIPKFAVLSVTPNADETAASTTSQHLAHTAEMHTEETSTTPPRVALYGVVGVTPSAPTLVYNLTVDVDHEYFADGLVARNCDSLLYARIAVSALLPSFQKSEPQATPSDGTSAPAAKAPPRLTRSEEEWTGGDASDGWTGADRDGWSSGDE